MHRIRVLFWSLHMFLNSLPWNPLQTGDRSLVGAGVSSVPAIRIMMEVIVVRQHRTLEVNSAERRRHDGSFGRLA